MPATIKEAVAAFDNQDALDKAVYELETRGFDRAAFSVLASESAVAQKLGHGYTQVKEVEDDPQAPRETFFSRVSRLEADYLPAPALAGIGALVVAGAGALIPVLVAAGAGAIAGAALGRMLHAHHAKLVEEQLARGGLLLWVNIRNDSEEKTALDILRAHAAHDVHVHEVMAP